MFEKVFACLLRLYPSRFREEYKHEAFQLIQDRLRDEQGFARKTRLMWDLVADGLFGLTQAHRNANTKPVPEALALAAEGIPSFMVLAEEPLSRASIVLGGALSLVTIIAFASLLGRSLAHAPTPQWNGRMSPIEAVVERLNQAMPTDTPLREPAQALSFTSATSSDPLPRVGLPVATSLSSARTPGFARESSGSPEGQNRAVPVAVGNPSKASVLPMARTAVGEGFAWNGSLTDAAGRPVRSAEIHVIGGTGELVEHTTADGRFAFPQLLSGDYEIMIVCDGREVAYRKDHLSATSLPPRLALASGGRVLLTQ